MSFPPMDGSGQSAGPVVTDPFTPPQMAMLVPPPHEFVTQIPQPGLTSPPQQGNCNTIISDGVYIIVCTNRIP